MIDINLRFSTRKGDRKLFLNRKGEFTKKYLSEIDTKANIDEKKYIFNLKKAKMILDAAFSCCGEFSAYWHATCHSLFHIALLTSI